jgi:hypothetical protein
MLTADVTAVSYTDLRTIIFMNFANRNLHEGPRKEVTAAMSGAATPATDFREEFLENESATNKVTQDHNAKAESLFEDGTWCAPCGPSRNQTYRDELLRGEKTALRLGRPCTCVTSMSAQRLHPSPFREPQPLQRHYLKRRAKRYFLSGHA